MRSVGAGAALLGGSAALSGSAAAQEPGAPPDPLVEGIERWSLTRERVARSEVQDGPTVSYEDDEVVVTGTHVFPRTGCDTFVAQRVFHDDTEARLGVIVDAVPTYTPDQEPIACADAEMPMRYELRVTPEGVTREVVVEEAFTDGERSFHPRNDEYQVEPPAEVAEYEFFVGEEAAPVGAESVAPTDADAMEPTVTFDGDDVIVQGAMTYGSSSCDEIGLERIERSYGVDGHVDVELEARRRRTWMPGDPCTLDVATDYYRLELTGSGDPPIDRCGVDESHTSGHRRVTVEDHDDELQLPDGVLDHRLRIGPEIADEDAVETDPTVRFDASDGDDAPDAVVIEGTMGMVSRACDTLSVGDVSWERDDQSHLLARVDEGNREGDTPICEPGSTTIEYALELAVEQLPDAVTAQEGHEVDDEPDRSVTVQRYGVGDHELPDGVRSYEIATEFGDQDDVRSAPSVALPESADEPVTIEGTLSEGPCETTVVTDVRWDDDGHLAVAVDAVARESRLVNGECPLGEPASPTRYTVELSVESVPDAVTAEEVLDGDGEPARSTTVERDGDDLPDGVLDYEFVVGDGATDEAVAADPSVSTGESADGPVVTVEGAILDDPCHVPALVDLGWEDDGHLAVAVDAVSDGDSDRTFQECPPDIVPYGTAYTVEVVLESLPDAVTASELNRLSRDPLRSVTVELGDGPCAGTEGGSAAVDGQTVCDVNGDGLYRDVTGNGAVGQTDVVEFFRVQHREAWKRPELFDFSGNGSVGHGDVVALFEDVATR